MPESVVEAFVAKIVVHPDSFDWYLRFNDDPDKSLHCTLEGKRKQTTKIMVSGGNSPTMDCSDTGCHQGWREIRRFQEKPIVRTDPQPLYAVGDLGVSGSALLLCHWDGFKLLIQQVKVIDRTGFHGPSYQQLYAQGNLHGGA